MNWIMSPFNPLFFAVSAVFLLALAGTSLLLRGKPERTRRTVLASACAATLAFFFVYKYTLSLDAEYNAITANVGGFNWWRELPLHLCNINMILIPIAALKKSRPLMCFGFFIGPLSAILALIIPGDGFDGYSLLLPRILGYYGTHFMIVIEGWALLTFGLFRPRFSDLPKAVAALFFIALAVFGINLLLRRTGLHPMANYFFTVETEGYPGLETFHSWIPVPFLYLLPGIGVLAVYMALVMALLNAAEKLLGKKRRSADP